MMRRIWIQTAVMLMALALFIVACAPQTVVVEQEETVAEEEIAVQEATEMVPGPELQEIMFASWAEDDFEEWALEELKRLFEETHPDIRIDLIIVR